jgi:hypothetical protein
MLSLTRRPTVSVAASTTHTFSIQLPQVFSRASLDLRLMAVAASTSPAAVVERRLVPSPAEFDAALKAAEEVSCCVCFVEMSRCSHRLLQTAGARPIFLYFHAGTASFFPTALSSALPCSVSIVDRFYYFVAQLRLIIDWCSDSKAVAPVFEAALQLRRRPCLLLDCLIQAPRDEYRSPSYPYRTHPLVRLTNIPTLVRWQVRALLDRYSVACLYFGTDLS